MKDLEQLLDEFMEAELSAEDFADLQNILRNDPAARQEYYRALALDQELTRRFTIDDTVSQHALAVKETWAERRLKRRWWFQAFAGAAAVVVLGLVAGLLVRIATPEYRGTISASADAQLMVTGERGPAGVLGVGESLVLKRGVVSIELNPYVEAIVEGPAELRVTDRKANLELLSGKALFEVSPGGKGLEVVTPGATLRDIGTSFGVIIKDDTEQVHVINGMVEILRDGERQKLVSAGEASEFGGGLLAEVPLDAAAFQRAVPRLMTLLRDDFDDPDGTLMYGKRSDIGEMWFVFEGREDLSIQNGIMDTSFAPRRLVIPLSEAPPGRLVYILKFTTAPLRTTKAKPEGYGTERISLARDGQPLVGVAGRGAQGHYWCIEDGEEELGQDVTEVSVFAEEELEFLYDSATGDTQLYLLERGERELLSERRVSPGLPVDSLHIANSNSGDVALDKIEVQVVVYPEAMESD